MKEWNGKPVKQMEDSHLINARKKAEEIIDSIQTDIDDTDEWQYDRIDRLERNMDEWQIRLAHLEEEIAARGLDQETVSGMLS